MTKQDIEDFCKDIDITENDFFSNSRDMEKLLLSVQKEYDKVCTELQETEKELKEYSKSKEIQSLKMENEKLRKNSLLILSDLEKENIKKFVNSHYLSCKNGNSYHYIITGLGMGTTLEVKCPVCGKIEDVTDYKAW